MDGQTDELIWGGLVTYGSSNKREKRTLKPSGLWTERARGTAARLGKEETKKKEIGPISRSA